VEIGPVGRGGEGVPELVVGSGGVLAEVGSGGLVGVEGGSAGGAVGTKTTRLLEGEVVHEAPRSAVE
jgi:hypothetical protein